MNERKLPRLGPMITCERMPISASQVLRERKEGLPIIFTQDPNGVYFLMNPEKENPKPKDENLN